MVDFVTKDIEILLLFCLFIEKHMWVDFKYQTSYMVKNKGTYGHLGGILHAGLHAAVSFILLMILYIILGATPDKFIMVGMVALAEGMIHYHIDWIKMWYCKDKTWMCDTNPKYWVAIGHDQKAHYFTYVAMVVALVYFYNIF